MVDFRFHTPDTAPDGSKALLAEGARKYGRVPAMYAAMAEAPALLEAYDAIQDLFMSSSFTKEEMTVVWQSVNVEHECLYCVPGHTLIAEMMGVDPAISRALRDETPLIDARLEALRAFTLQMVRQRGAVSGDQVEGFLSAGFDRQHVFEVILGIAQKVMSNFTNHVAATPVDGQLEPYAWRRRA
ncbi:carboxymuconolactone decarboxylase family protein [Algicella marina]|uniref:Carboxymuconolactone decarboxylase family protein n=1 Tax=Algicella marina TaxID=2683284 RepID=A0A6P1T303_9RHOB|nr:carboxymuconolactone decarboxylase family protein [Algicella marina]QHQ36125.1 carboxymuconolactone decarboxylase family protein [Algicella marina]